jgi:outer membrane protein TolC
MELRTVLGITEDVELLPTGDLNLLPDAEPTGERVVAAALAMQPELQAKIAAFMQADAAVALARANAWPDVTAGPTFEYDESKTVFVGGTLQIPLQVFNRKQGELMQAEAERARASADLEQSQVKVRMRALAAWQHYDNARRVARFLREEAGPASQRHAQDADKLFAAGQMDLLKVVEIRRRHLALREQLLEAESRAESYRIELEVLTGRVPLPASGDVPHE